MKKHSIRTSVSLLLILLELRNFSLCSCFLSEHLNNNNNQQQRVHPRNQLSSSAAKEQRNNDRIRLNMSLKPAAIPLMDSGKALARSGELLIDLTSKLELYGGGLSAAGAFIRNSGDCIAQAAAICRFKTGYELVCDELRESATCLAEATSKLKLAVEEAEQDEDEQLAKGITGTIDYMAICGEQLECAGAGIMKKEPLEKIGQNLITCGENLELLAIQIQSLASPDIEEGQISGQRMLYASERMILAGNELKGVKPKPQKGKAWLKGGGF